MGKSLKQKLEEQGEDTKALGIAIRQRGLLPVADERGWSLESITNYAQEVLGINDAPLVNKDYIKPNSDITRELISGMFTIWQEIKAENERLKAELQKVHQAEAHRDALVKGQLIEMLNAVRG